MVKKILRLLVAVFIFCLLSFLSFADQPPDPGGGGPGGGTPVGGSSPIGGGLIITLVLGVIYGTRKMILYPHKK